MNRWLSIVLIILMLGSGYWWGKNQATQKVDNQNPKGEMVPMGVGEAKLRVEVRDTDEGRELGLSYRDNLNRNEGMLFVFEEEGQYAFWMKGMRFGLDLIWIKDGRVVEISANLPPPLKDETPDIASPKMKVDMVLEVVAGWAEANRIKVGDRIEFGSS